MIAETRDGKRFVSDVYDGSPAARAGVLVGDELLDVDGAPYREIASFAGKFARKVAVRLRRHAGAEPISIAVSWSSTWNRCRPSRTRSRGAQRWSNATAAGSATSGWTLSAPRSMDVVAEALAEGPLEDVDGFCSTARALGRRQFRRGRAVPRTDPEFKLVGRNHEDMIANVRWHKPLVAIIDQGSRSGLELFAYSLKINGVRLVGSRTAGALLAGRAFLLPDDSLLEIAVADAVIGDDVRLEGAGVEPDVPVAFDLPYAAGWDMQRVAAVEEMRRMLAGE